MNPLKIPNPSPSLSSAAIKARYRCLQSHWQPPSPYHPHQAVNMPIGGCWCIASVDHPSCHWQGTKTPMTRVENLATNSSGESEYRAGMSNKVLHISLCQNPLSAWLSKTLGIVLGWPRHFAGSSACPDISDVYMFCVDKTIHDDSSIPTFTTTSERQKARRDPWAGAVRHQSN